MRIWPHAAAATKGDDGARTAFEARLKEILSVDSPLESALAAVAGISNTICRQTMWDVFFSFKPTLQRPSSGVWTSRLCRTGCRSSCGWACGCAQAGGRLHRDAALATPQASCCSSRSTRFRPSRTLTRTQIVHATLLSYRVSANMKRLEVLRFIQIALKDFIAS